MSADSRTYGGLVENTGTVGTSLPVPPPPPSGTSVELKVGRRLLWVGEAAYPLHNITRVHTLVLRPKRMEAFMSFLKWLGIIVVAFVLLQMVNANSASPYDEQAGSDSASTLRVLGIAVVIGLALRLAKEWSAPSQHVLAVETSSASTALVTLPNPEQLRQLVRYLVNAIENPEAEFHVRVERVLVNPKNYHFGDNVNMYGGLYNTGVSK
ncbi:DUF6232 family protein [Streptomyces sp. NPDC088400]|uniref:DUF6232 family protein n=1 Tax=Streptomyces sp. NPDC088400 TaxID=3365861 RepID=UPI003813DF94